MTGEPDRHGDSLDASIVIPTCNRRDILARCLSALVNQTCPSYEIIVVDDYSTDETAAMLNDFAAQHPHVNFRWLRNEQHLGINPSRNRGIQAARGKFVAFLDSDCIAERDWLEKLLAGFTSPRVAAVVGRVDDPPARNIYELALSGVARVHGSGPAPRLVGGNLAVRRSILLEYGFDEDARWKSPIKNGVVQSPVCDEESLFLTLRAAGYEQRVVPDAAVLHMHPYDRAAFLKQALAGGRGAAYLVHKYYLPHRIDLLPWMLTYLTAPLAVFGYQYAAIPAAFMLAALAAVAYNEIARKGKTPGQLIRCYPALFIYYQLRLIAYVSETIRLKLGLRPAQRIRLKGAR